MANPQMFVEVVTTGAQAAVTVVGHGNDVGDAFGDDKDFVIVLKSAVNGANTGITDVLEGTPVTPALPVNSAILSNTTANGDLLIAANTGSNSEAVFWADASAGDTAVMAASGGSADIYIAGTKEYDFSASSADFNANTIDGVGTIKVNNAAGPAVISIAATTTAPTLVPNRAELDTGIGWASDTLHVVLGGSNKYSFSATTFDMGNNTLANVGASGNDWTTNKINLESAYSGESNTIQLYNTSTDASSGSRLVIRTNTAAGGDPRVQYTVDGVQEAVLGIDASDSGNLKYSDGSTIGASDRLRLVTATGVLSVDGDGGGSDDPVSLFDNYDDAVELDRYAHATLDVPDITSEQRLVNRERLVEMGVAEWAVQAEGPDHLMIRMQPMTKLLAGGIYQNRHRMDAQNEAMNERLARIEAAIGV